MPAFTFSRRFFLQCAGAAALAPVGASASAWPSVTVHKASGYDELDEKVVAAVWGWRYQPFIVDRAPRAFCVLQPFRWDIE